MMKFQNPRLETWVLFSVVLVLSVSVIWIRTATVKSTYQYVQKENELKKLGSELQALRLQWLKQTAPQRLEQLAENLEMQAPTLGQISRVRTPLRG